jgi:hypothetical protein
VSTCQDLCDRAGRLLFGKNLTTTESADAFIAVNAMLGSWNNERLMCYAVRDESLTLTGATTYTIGPSGNLNTTRPVEIIDAYVLSGTARVPVRVLTAAQWDALPDPSATGDFPAVIYYQPSMPTGTLYSTPLGSSGPLHLITRTPLTAFAALTDTVSLPPGWEDAIAYNLAIRLAPEFQIPVRPDVLGIARDTKAAIKTVNSESLTVPSELAALVNGNTRGHILTDS